MSDEPLSAAPPIANELLRALFVALKAAGVYARGNDGFRRHGEAAREILSRALSERGAARLEARGDLLFFNGQRVRLQVEDSAGARYLLTEMARRGVGAIDLARGGEPGRLDAFLFAFRALDPRKGEGLEILRERLAAEGAEGVEVAPPAAAEPEAAEGEGGGGEGRRAAQKAFYQAVTLVEEVMTRARDGRETAFAPAKRVVQALVERVVDDEQALFELATLRSFDEYTFAHSVNVCVYSVSIGARLGLDRAMLSELGFAALFHDLGKSKLPLALIDKPDEFTEDEWVQMRRHPAFGAKALLSMRRSFDRALARAVVVAFEHHRGLDGKGYPRALRPRRQDLFARVCAIADAFDAMTSGRVYARRPLGPAEALARMAKLGGKAFDPFLLRAFISAIGVFPIGTPLLLDDGRVGVVWRNDAADLLRPKVRVLGGSPGAETLEVVDLARVDPATNQPLVSAVRPADAAELGLDVARLLSAADPA